MAIIKINETITKSNGFAQGHVGRLFSRIEKGHFGSFYRYTEKMDGRICDMVSVDAFGSHLSALVCACQEAKAAYLRPEDTNWTWILNRETHPTQADLAEREEKLRLAEKEAERRLIEQKKMEDQARTAAAAKAMAAELAAKEASKKMKEAAFGSKPSKKDRRDAKVGSNTSPKSNRAKPNSAPTN